MFRLFVCFQLHPQVSGIEACIDSHSSLLLRRIQILPFQVQFNLKFSEKEQVQLLPFEHQGMMMPLAWPEIQMNGGGQLVQEQWINESLAQPDWVREDDECDLLTPENSLLSYDFGNSDCEVYNLGIGKATSVLEMVKAFEKASGKKILLVMAGR